MNTARPATGHTRDTMSVTGIDIHTGRTLPGVPQLGAGGVNALILVVLAVISAMTVPTAKADSPDQTQAAGGVQLMCPVTTDEKIDPEVSLQYQGQTIYFCCQKCRVKFEHSPEKYMASIVTVSGPADPYEPGEAGSSSSAAGDHDLSGHQHHHDQGDGSDNEVLETIGNLHVLAVHFPIALLITAALARCLMLFGSVKWAGPAVRFCVWLGGISAVAAATLGWINAGWPDDEWFGDVIFNHRWLGVSTAIVAVALIVLIEKEERKPTKNIRMWTTLGLLLGAALVSATGYFGGILVYGPDYLPW